MAKQKAAHRERLLRTAIRIFGKHGYHAATVPQITKEAGSSTGAFYFYFKNKEHVFAAALETIGEEVSDALNQAIVAAGDNTLSQMKAAVESFVLYLAKNPDHARILIVESSGLSDELLQVRRKIISSHRRSVEQAIKAIPNLKHRIDPKIASSCWVGAIHEATYQWLETPKSKRISAASLAREIWTFNLRGIGAQESEFRSARSSRGKK
jgi:TetR/AcrR family transcriptional regulator, fatty acid metabolism regulator protein